MQIEPIATLHSCFGEKFAVPRQPGLCPSAWGRVVLSPEHSNSDCLRGIEGFSHLWLIFGFHLTAEQGWSPTVRPPRLGGNEKVGVFASRSTFRPNGLGLSLVKLDCVTDTADGAVLEVSGVDLVDGTPIFDIKPYLPYAESQPEALGGYAAEAPPRIPVEGLENLAGMDERDLRVVEEVLSLDPRPPAGRDEPDRVFGAYLCGRNVRFRFVRSIDGEGLTCQVVDSQEISLGD